MSTQTNISSRITYVLTKNNSDLGSIKYTWIYVCSIIDTDRFWILDSEYISLLLAIGHYLEIADALLEKHNILLKQSIFYFLETYQCVIYALRNISFKGQTLIWDPGITYFGLFCFTTSDHFRPCLSLSCC